jgi:hypothetical protein
MPRREPRSSRAAAIFAALLGAYLLTTGGHFYAVDEEQMYGLTSAIATRGPLSLNAPALGEPPVYSTYGPGLFSGASPPPRPRRHPKGLV